MSFSVIARRFATTLLLLIAPVAHAALPVNFVYLRSIDPSVQQEIRYASNHNFVGLPIDGYEASACILTRDAALALSKVQTELKKSSLSLKVYDCYRPQKAVDHFIAWSKQKDKQEMKAEFYPRVNKEDFFKLGYVAEKSGHTRGSTIDLTIVPEGSAQTKYYTGEKLVACYAPRNQRFADNSIDMGTGYDCMDERAHADNKEINVQAYQHRQLLRSLMEQNGFIPYPSEWWHFTLKDEPYPHTYFDFNVSSDSPASLQNLQASLQLLMVLTDDWNANSGFMQRYQRKSLQQNWQAIGKPIQVVVGEHGLALGVDMQDSHIKGPIKKEGDLRTPMGIYKIGPAFGFAAQADQTIKMPYMPLTTSTFCVDDIKSNYYNQIIDQTKLKSDWNSGEQMRTVPVYKIGAVINYNHDQPVYGAGSCIFLHIWQNSTTGTAGCVAMDETKLKEVLMWLDKTKKPALAIFTKKYEAQIAITHVVT